MPRFKQTIDGQATVYVTAADMYEADEIISNMEIGDIMNYDVEFFPSETTELPREV